MSAYDNFDKRFITPMWEMYNDGIVKDLLPDVPHNFMRHPSIEGTMATRGAVYTDARIDWLEQQYGVNNDFLAACLHDPRIGDPSVIDRYGASDMTVGHLYHIVRYAASVSTGLLKVNSIVEWGGGYGNMARMIMQICPFIKSYTIIDTPAMCAIQSAYLERCGVRDVNIVSLEHIDNFAGQADMFISTWALTESGEYAGEYLESRKWYGANSFLFAYCPESWNTKRIKSISDIKIESCGEYMEPNEYAFK